MAKSQVATAYVQVMPSMEGVAPAVKAEFTGAGESAGNFFSGTFGTALKVGLGAAAAAAGVIIKESLEEGAGLQQSIGGIETLFGAGGKSIEEYAASVGESVGEISQEYTNLMMAQEAVFANADQAYRTAGMSANEYMETVTGFSASLIASLEGDTVRAADVANMALIDISDNANKMGSDAESLKMAYQGFAKGQYQLLDNLKLGYGGTKTEMERLLADAQKLSGVKYNIDNLADVYTAIHVIQEEMGITGTTVREAATTLTGSFASMKAAAQNVLGNLALGEPTEQSLEELKTTFNTFLNGNLMPMVGNILNGLPNLVGTGVANVVGWLTTPENIADALSAAGEFGWKMAESIWNGIASGLEKSRMDRQKWMEMFGGAGSHDMTSAPSGVTQGVPGFAKGLDYVPYDNFLARLHEGEMVLTKSQANAVRSGKTSGVQVVQYIYSEAKTAADLMQAARYEQERAVLGIG